MSSSPRDGAQAVGGRKKMISEMFKKENIQILECVENWQQAVHLSLKPLEAGGYVEPRYADEIIRSTEEMGPYYVLTDDVALVHGRPEQGVIKKQLAVTIVREPVVFSEDSYPVRILIALAATDSNSHVDVMRVLASIFIDEEKIKTLANSKSAEEIYEFFLNEEK